MSIVITSDILDGLFRGFSTSFNKGFEGAEKQWPKIAMLAPSSTRETTYAWLGQAPRLREWLGERIVKSLALYGYKIEIVSSRTRSRSGAPTSRMTSSEFSVRCSRKWAVLRRNFPMN